MADTPSIHVLMPRVMASVGAIGKNQRNPEQGFVFRGIDDAMNAVQPALVEHGVHYSPEVLEHEVEKYETRKGTAMKSVTVKVAYTFYGPAGDSFRTVTMGEAADSGDKAVGKAQSIALKFALLHALCIPTKDMADPDGEAHERAPARPAPTPATEAQLNTIEGLLHDLDDDTKAEVKAWWKQRWPKLADLSYAQANEVLSYVESRLPDEVPA